MLEDSAACCARRSPSPMALATQLNSKCWMRLLRAVTTAPEPRRGWSLPSGLMWNSSGPRLLATMRGRRSRREAQREKSSCLRVSSVTGICMVCPFPRVPLDTLADISSTPGGGRGCSSGRCAIRTGVRCQWAQYNPTRKRKGSRVRVNLCGKAAFAIVKPLSSCVCGDIAQLKSTCMACKGSGVRIPLSPPPSSR